MKEKGARKVARPRKEIDQKDFESLCALQCTKEEICGFFDVSDKTLENWCKRTYSEGFSEVFKKKRGKGKISLRRAQFRLAEKSASMAIWLGKQWLGQKDTGSYRDKRTKSKESRRTAGKRRCSIKSLEKSSYTLLRGGVMLLCMTMMQSYAMVLLEQEKQ